MKRLLLVIYLFAVQLNAGTFVNTRLLCRHILRTAKHYAAAVTQIKIPRYVPELSLEEIKRRPEDTFRHLSFNGQRLKTQRERSDWENYRAIALAKHIAIMDADTIHLQELSTQQIRDVLELLPTYELVADAARNPFEENPEHSVILVKKGVADVDAKGEFWLSETPTVAGSFSWDAKKPRVVSWSVLDFKAQQEKIIYVSFHFTPFEALAQKRGVEVFARELMNLQKRFPNVPMLLSGDANFWKGHENDNYLRSLWPSLLDVQETASDQLGVSWSFQSFGILQLLIDRGFHNNRIVPTRTIVDNRLIDDERSSDHNPLVIDFLLRRND